MKVLILCAIPATYDQFLLETAEELRRRGHDVTVGCNSEIRGDVKWLHIPFSRRPRMLPALRSAARLRSLRKEYDLVQVHTPVAAAILRIALFLTRVRPTIVYMAHGFHFQGEGDGFSEHVWRLIEWTLSWNTDHFQVLNGPDEKAVLKWGRDVTRFPSIGYRDGRVVPRSEIEIGPQRRFPRVTFIGELNDNKGTELLADLVASSPDGWEWRVAGQGPLRRLLVPYCVGERLVLCGQVEDVRALLSEATVFVNLSRREGVPVSVLEAIASGVPVVALSNRGTRELLTNEQFGRIITRDVEAILRVVSEVSSAGRSRPPVEWLALHDRCALASKIVDDLEAALR